ncbi:MAG: flippase [Candidatus Pacebacteria bacterium]|nr:flippase [Candidatus Paceibacterota bacterium]
MLKIVSKIKNFLFSNTSVSQTVIKNTVWLLSGKTASQLLRAILVIFAARVLGPASWGAFSYAMSLSAFLLIFTDIGLTAIVTRESAKNQELSHKYFSTAFSLKIILISLGVLFVIIGTPYITNIAETKILLPAVALMLVFDSLRNFGFAISRATQKMQIEALDEIATNLIIIAFGFYFLSVSPTSLNLTFSYLMGVIAGFLIIFITFKKYFLNFAVHFDNKIIKALFSASLPFALASFLGAIMINTDLIMIGWLRSPDELGFYSAAQKPVLLLYTIAGLFATSLFPVLAKAATDKERFRNILEKSLAATLSFAIPAAIGGMLLSNQIMTLLFGAQYAPASAAFQFLLITLVIIFPSVIISNSLLAYNEQKNLIAFSAIGAVGNIVFNFLLIPSLGITGAAISTVLTQITANSFIWNKMYRLNNFNFLPRVGKIIFASILMAFAILILKATDLPVLADIAIAAVFYIAVLKIQKEEILEKIF